MGQKLFEIALAGVVAGAAALYVVVEEGGPARQLSDQWLRESSVADWASRLVADTIVGPAAAELALQATTPTVLSHPQAATWMVVGNLAIPEADGGRSLHTYRVVVQRLCDRVNQRTCWRIYDLELDGGPIAVEETTALPAEAPAAALAPGPTPEPAPEPVGAAAPASPPAEDPIATPETASEDLVESQPPVKPAPADEVLQAAAVAEETAAAVRPAPEAPPETPPETPSAAASESPSQVASAAPDDSATEATPADAMESEASTPDESGSAAPQQAALPTNATTESDDAGAGDVTSSAPNAGDSSTEDASGDTAAANADVEQTLYTWADPKLLIPIQHQLAARGFRIGTIDGILGPRTREAIESYQGQNGLRVDGKASAALLRHMAGEQADTTEDAPQADQAADAPPAAAGGAAPPPPVLAGTSGGASGDAAAATPIDGTELVRRIQQRLQRLGYVVDQPAGTMGSYTREAISTYQWRYGLPVDGQPSADLLTHLQRQAGG